MFANLTQMDMLLAGLMTLFVFFVGHKIGSFFTKQKFKREFESLEKESHSSNKSLKRILEEEKNQVDAKNLQLEQTNTLLKEKVEEYRKKLAGMGVLSFSGSKKRSDILYSLLLENEALEQLIAEQGDKLADERKGYMIQRMTDIRKRQRLMAELFNDDTIKNYVKDVLSDDKKMEDAMHRIEGEADETRQIEQEDQSKTEA